MLIKFWYFLFFSLPPSPRPEYWLANSFSFLYWSTMAAPTFNPKTLFQLCVEHVCESGGQYSELKGSLGEGMIPKTVVDEVLKNHKQICLYIKLKYVRVPMRICISCYLYWEEGKVYKIFLNMQRLLYERGIHIYTCDHCCGSMFDSLRKKVWMSGINWLCMDLFWLETFRTSSTNVQEHKKTFL